MILTIEQRSFLDLNDGENPSFILRTLNLRDPSFKEGDFITKEVSGLEKGEGKFTGEIISFDPNSVWILFAVNGKRIGWSLRSSCNEGILEEVESPKGVVVKVGTQQEVTSFLYKLCPDRTIVGLSREDLNNPVIVGDYGEAITGDHSFAQSGEEGLSSSGDYSLSITEDFGVAYSGSHGKSISGIQGSSSSGDFGLSVTGSYGFARSGVGGTLILHNKVFKIGDLHPTFGKLEPNVWYCEDGELQKLD